MLSGLASSGGSKQAVYRKLQKELQYDLYEDGVAVRTPAELATLALKARSSGESSMLFRYSGSETRLISDLQTLYEEGFDDLRYKTSSQDGTWNLKVELYWQ
ncbi:hypothetical protein D3C72_2211330 [compost metagenome]